MPLSPKWVIKAHNETKEAIIVLFVIEKFSSMEQKKKSADVFTNKQTG
jgi:hypothetical protein